MADQPEPAASVAVAAVGARAVASAAVDPHAPVEGSHDVVVADAAPDDAAAVPVPGAELDLVPPAPVDAVVVAPAAVEALPLLTGVATATAPPVPVVHWVGPCLSQAGGYGAVWASRLTPLGENVGLLQDWMLMLCTSAPGILAIWAKPASTRLMGIGE